MARLRNMARMSVASAPGTGTITLASAVSGWLSFSQAGVQDGEIVTYFAVDGAAREIGRGTYTASGTTLARTTILRSTNSNAAVNLTASAQVAISPAAEDFLIETNAQTGTSYTIVGNDLGKLVTFSNASAVAVTLPQATTSGLFSAGWFCRVYNSGAGVVTITPTTSTINGLSSLALGQGQGVLIVSNGSNYLVDRTPAGRETLNSARTYYVRTDGSDSNNGLANTSGGAFLTIQKAIDVAASLDTSIHDVTIQIASGTYTTSTGLVLKNAAGAGIINLVGDTTTPSNVVISTNGAMTTLNAIILARSVQTRWAVRGFRINSTASGTVFGIHSSANSYIEWQALDFGAGTTQHLRADDGGVLRCTGNYSISAGAGLHATAAVGGVLRCQSVTVTLTGTPAFTTFIEAFLNGSVIANGNTYSGSATGVRYSASLNGAINTQGAGATYFPGDTSGTTATGGQYG